MPVCVCVCVCVHACFFHIVVCVRFTHWAQFEKEGILETSVEQFVKFWNINCLGAFLTSREVQCPFFLVSAFHDFNTQKHHTLHYTYMPIISHLCSSTQYSLLFAPTHAIAATSLRKSIANYLTATSLSSLPPPDCLSL